MNRDNPTAGSLPQARPATDVISQLVLFVKHPAITNGRNERAPLQQAARNFIASVLLVALATTALSALLHALDAIPFSSIIRPGRLTLLLAGQVLVCAFVVWLLTAAIGSFRKRGPQLLCFLQVLQSWAVLNLFVVLIVWSALDRLFISVNANRPLSTELLVCAGLYGVALLGLALHLLILPVIRHLARFYGTALSTLFTVLIFTLAGYTSLPLFTAFSSVVFDSEQACITLNTLRNPENLPGRLPDQVFIDSCRAQFH